MNYIEYDLLFESRNQLIEEITELDETMLHHRPASEVWSIAQICHHLYLTEQVFTEAIANGIRERDFNNIIQKTFTLLLIEQRNSYPLKSFHPLQPHFNYRALWIFWQNQGIVYYRFFMIWIQISC